MRAANIRRPGQQIALMDQSMSMAASDGTFLTTYKDYDSQRAYLEQNHYLLNSYFTLEPDGGGSTFRYQGDQILGGSVKGTKKGTYAAGYAAGNGMTGMVREGSRVHTFDPSREWYYATLKRNGISVGTEEYDKDTIWNGNTVNMVAKGDVEYSYALEGYSDEITEDGRICRTVWAQICVPGTDQCAGTRCGCGQSGTV